MRREGRANMSHESFQITLTAAQFDALKAKLAGMNLGADYERQGTLPEMSGVVLSYVVTNLANVAIVNFTVLKKPWIVGLGMIRSKVEEFVRGEA